MNMPLLYEEGDKAFVHLQDKSTEEHLLFLPRSSYLYSTRRLTTGLKELLARTPSGFPGTFVFRSDRLPIPTVYSFRNNKTFVFEYKRPTNRESTNVHILTDGIRCLPNILPLITCDIQLPELPGRQLCLVALNVAVIPLTTASNSRLSHRRQDVNPRGAD